MAGLGGIQTSVNQIPAPGVEGAFCTLNPRYSALAGPGAFIAGAAGVTVGRFCWATAPADGDGSPSIVSSSGSGPVTGFVANEQQALITTFLADAGMVIPSGFPVTVYSEAEVWVRNAGSTRAVSGQKAYANFSGGAATFAATGTPTGGAFGDQSTITPSTSSFTGSIANDTLTVTALTGVVAPGTTIAGAGVASGTKVVRQLSGNVGAAGTYAVDIAEQTVAAEAMTGTYGLLTVAGNVSGTFHVGDILTVGGNIAANTALTGLGTGTGGAGTYYLNANPNVGAGNISVAAVNVETKWVARSTGLAGELVKISPILQG